MSGRPLAVISTRLPPATCGVGSHSALLRQHWPATSGPVHFFVVAEAATAIPPLAGDRITQFDGSGVRLARELESLGEADVILHYAGRAYDRFGCPVWLPRAIARWKQQFPGSRLLLFAHEVPGEMLMRSRHFWLGKVNAWILRRLSMLAEVIITNTETHRERLGRITGRADIEWVPVGSNIDNASDDSTARARTEFVVFGLPFGRWQTLRFFESHLKRWLASGQLTRLHIIGPERDQFTEQANQFLAPLITDTVVTRHGALPAAEVSRLLHRAQFALTNVTAETWSKSGAFMACALHRCTPVIHTARGANVPLSYAAEAGEVEHLSDEELRERAQRLHTLYQENAAWTVVAPRLAAMLENVA